MNIERNHPRSSISRERVRVLLWSMAMMCSGVLILITLILTGGCQSHSRITPATSTAAREIDEKRPRTVWRVIVEPSKGGAR